jgi:hypothetical protein
VTGAQMAPYKGQWVVTCTEHDWRWQVATEGHALNLLRKHDRENEHQAAGGGPATLDLTKAAQYVLTCQVDAGDLDAYRDPPPHDRPFNGAESAYFAALDMWEALTGLTGDPALAYAQQVADTPTTAVLTPF